MATEVEAMDPQTQDLRAVDIIARRLQQAGCRFAFGIPGGEVLTLVDALERAGIRFVLTKHENCAGFMAEGVFQITGAPAILVTTVGPGLANGVNVIANAAQDRVPLIVLTGCVDAEEALTYSHQVFDHQALLRPITKASFKLGTGSVDVLADRLVSTACDDRPGPVHLDLPISLAGAVHPPEPGIRRTMPSPVAPAPGPDLDRAREWLQGARRPLILAGLDAVAHDAGEALERLARCLDAPVITTYKAKGLIAEDHPLSLSAAGLSPRADAALLPLVRKADCLVLAGYDPIEMRTGWRDAFDPDSQHVVELTSSASDQYMHRSSVSFVCHIAKGLEALTIRERERSSWSDGEPAAARQALADSAGQDESWGPAAIIDSVRSLLPRDGIATVDSGAHRILLSQIWRCYAPRTLLQSNGLCTMGCALPLAMGARLAAPGRPVVCFTGDAGLEMILGELATARDLAIPVIVVVFVDASLALIELKQRSMQLPNAGVDFQATDFAAVARALGGNGVTVRSRSELNDAFSAALEAPTFTVLGCVIDRRGYDGRL